MDPTIKGVVIGGLIAAGAGVATQFVTHMLERRARKADEIRRVAPAFVDAVYNLKLRLDNLVGWLAGLVPGRSPEVVEKRIEEKTAAISEELNTDRVTILNVQFWQIQVTCGRDAAGTAEEIVDRLKDYYAEVKRIQMAKLSEDWTRVHEGGDKCRALSKEVENLLRRFAQEVRGTKVDGDGSAAVQA